MVKRTSADPQAENPSAPPRLKSGTRATEPIRASVQLMTEVVGGTAGAVSDGFEAFAEGLSEDSVRQRGLFNGFVEGAIAGQTRFLRSLAETFDRVQEGFRDLEGEARERPAQESIDYERLAKAVAAAMRQGNTGE